MSLEYSKMLNFLHSMAARQGKPLGATFELTSRCTLNCKMCYIHRSCFDCETIKYEKDTNWWISLAEQVKSSGVLTLLLTGGEPTLRDDFDEIYTFCHSSGLLTSVNTNGTLLTDNRKALFEKYRPQRLNITLYGFSANTYEALCSNGKMFETVKNNIIDINKAGIPVRLNYTITEYNKHELEQVFDFAASLKIPAMGTSYLFPPTRTFEKTEGFQRFPPREAGKLKLEWRRKVFGDNLLSERYSHFLKGFELRNDNVECDEQSGFRINCRAGLTTFWVSWDGKISPCGMITEPSFPINDFNEAWNQIKESRNSIMLPAKCRNCKIKDFCDGCAGINKSENGASDIAADYMCKYAEAYYEACRELFEK